MSGTFSQNYAPQFAGGIFQVASQFVGQSLVENILKQFPRRKTQRGDLYVEHACQLIDENLTVMNSVQQQLITVSLETVINKRDQLEADAGSKLEMFLLAREFKCLSKQLYIITKRATDKGRSESLLSQMKQAIGAVELNNRNPFAGSPTASSFTNSSADSLERVELATYRSTATGDGAVAMTVHEQGVPGPGQEVFIALPEALTSGREGHGAQTSMVLDPEQDPQGQPGAEGR